MNFNIDFLTNQMIKKKLHSGRISVQDLRQLVKVMYGVQRAVGRLLTLKAFQKISVSRRPRVCHLECVQRITKNKLKSAFFDLKRGAALNKKYVMNKEQLLNYPLAVVKRWTSGKMASNQAEAFAKLKNNMLFIRKCEIYLDSMAKVQKEYIRKSYFVDIMSKLKSKITKKVQYISHLGSFDYLFDCMRIRVLFETFTHLAIKSTQKNIGELERYRARKKDSARSVYIKRSEVHNDLKRKINHILTQINENQINNDRRKVNGLRENGLKLLKINEQTRISMDSISYLQFQVETLQKEIERKSMMVHARSSQTMSLDQFKEIYDNVLQIEQENIVKKVAPDSRIQIFKESPNFLVLENAKLKHQVNIYERMSSAKKESYYIAQNENTYIKQILQSIIRHNLMTDIAAEMIEIAESTRDHVKQYRKQWRKVKSVKPGK